MAPQAKLVDTTLVCDTSVYAAGDLLVATQKIPDTVRVLTIQRCSNCHSD